MDPDLVRQQEDEAQSYRRAHNGSTHIATNGGAGTHKEAETEAAGDASCCAAHQATTHPHGAHAHAGHSPSLRSSAYTTLHCLTGCIIGETAGLAIGVTYGLPPWQTIILATALAFISGLSLAIFPLMRRENLSFASALRVIWLGEVISIGVMEVAMNSVDYMAGGMRVASVADPHFWVSLGLAAGAGFLAAWPVNHALLKRELKRCH